MLAAMGCGAGVYGIGPDREVWRIWNPEGLKMYKLDVQYKLHFDNFRLQLSGHSESRIFSERVLVEGYFVPNDLHALALLALHVVYDKGGIVADKHKILIMELKRRVYQDTASVSSLDADIILAAKKHCLVMKSSGYIKGQRLALKICNRISAELYRRVRWLKEVAGIGNAVSICFVGPDGSGKTTLSEKLSATLSGVVVRRLYLGGEREYWKICKVIEVQKRKYEKEYAVSKKLLSYCGSRFYDCLAQLIYPINARAEILKKKRGAGVLLMDRHPLYDLYAASRRLRGVKKLYVQVLCFYNLLVLSRPDCLIICSGNSEVIWMRKREMDIKTQISNQNAYERLYNIGARRTVIIDTTKKIEESIRELGDFIFNSRRTRSVKLFYKK